MDEGVSFVMADIPGIIEGAAEGAGLGHDFLRHIDRCRLLIHVVDVSGSEGRDPVEDFQAINEELRQYSPELASRKMIVAANKVDIMQDPELLQRLREHVQAQGLEFFEISAAAHQGTRELVKRCAQELQDLPPVAVFEPTYVERPPEVDTSGEGIYGVKFLLYDEDRNPIGEFTSDDEGWVYITADDLPDGANTSGRFYLRELEDCGGLHLRRGV